jgi:hypothetical protein
MWNNRAEYDPNYVQKMKEQWKKTALTLDKVIVFRVASSGEQAQDDN